MGKIKQGILGGFNGTTGSVVGASWKGIAYMRGKAQSIKNPRTQSQQSNRNLFGFVSDFASRNNAVITLGFAERAIKKSAYNAFIQKNLRNGAFNPGTPAPSVNFAVLEFSDGTLHDCEFGAPTITSTGCSVSATLDSAPGTAVVIAVEEDNLATSYESVAITTSESETVALTLPSDMQSKNVRYYGFFADEAGKIASDTFYLGRYENQ